jgi:hypothetical protein
MVMPSSNMCLPPAVPQLNPCSRKKNDPSHGLMPQCWESKDLETIYEQSFHEKLTIYTYLISRFWVLHFKNERVAEVTPMKFYCEM